MRKVAYIDSDGSTYLYWADEYDNCIEEIPWPSWFPESVSVKFLQAVGFEVIH